MEKQLDRLFRVLNGRSAVKFSESDFDLKFGNRDWRKYVPKEIRNLWKTFSTETKHIIFIMAEMQARKEAYKEPIEQKESDYLPECYKETIKNKIRK